MGTKWEFQKVVGDTNKQKKISVEWQMGGTETNTGIWTKPKSCEILYLCNLTSENVHSEARYLIKILLAAS